MQEQLNSTAHDYEALGDEISLIDIVRPLWRSRWLIIFVTLLVVAGALAGTFYFKSYKSEGFVQFDSVIPPVKGTNTYTYTNTNTNTDADADADAGPSSGISLADYKRYSAAFSSSEQFADFVREKKLESTVGINSLYRTFASSNGIGKQIEPLKDRNNIIGLNINYASRSPEIAQQIVSLLGRYVMDSIIYQIVSDDLKFRRNEIIFKSDQLNDDIITNKELLGKYSRKSVDLKQIAKRYPDSSKKAAAQVFFIAENGASYLPPVTQLMATEVQASEANESIRSAKRELRQNTLWLKYYDSVNELLDKTKSGETLFRGLESVKESVFKGKNLDDDAIKEVYNQITNNNQKAINLYPEKNYFITGPTLPTYSSPSKRKVLLVSLVLGLFLSFLLVFARIWWRDNWQKVSD